MKTDVFLHSVGQLAGIGGWRLDLLTQKLEWSDATCLIHDVPAGYQPTLQEAIDFYTPEARPQVAAAVQRGIDSGVPWEIEFPMVTAKGRRIWTRSVGAVQTVDGTAVALAGALQDITASKDAQRQQRADAATMRDLYDNAPCGHYTLDAKGVFLSVNQTVQTWLACTSDMLIGLKRPADFFSPESQAHFETRYPQFLTAGFVNNVEFELRPPNAPQRFVSVSATAVRDEQGTFVRSRSVMFDITELVRLRQQAADLALDQHAMLDNDLVGIVKLQGRNCTWANQAMHRIFGYEPGELVGLSSRVLYIDEESFNQLGITAYPILQSGGTVKIELEMQRKDASRVWIGANGTALHGERGESMWLMADITESRRHQQDLQHVAFHDALTGLPNRLLLGERLNQALAVAGRSDRWLAVCYLDLDGFKAVNDQHGHAAGDRLLVEMAGRLLACIRPNDTASRLGGDEFVVVLSDFDNLTELEAAVRRILAKLAEPMLLAPETQVAISASIGVAIYPADAQDKGILLRRADQAMYHAKALGKNQFARCENLNL